MASTVAAGVEAPARELDTSVGKALALLEAFRTASRPMGVTELARKAQLPKSTAYRLLAILREWGYVDRSGSDYCLGAHLFELGNLVPYCQPRGLREIALPHLVRLYETTHETVHLAVLDETDVLFIEKISGHPSASLPSRASGIGSPSRAPRSVRRCSRSPIAKPCSRSCPAVCRGCRRTPSCTRSTSSST